MIAFAEVLSKVEDGVVRIYQDHMDHGVLL